MKQYIDKDALVSEIEKEIKNIYAGREYVGIPSWEEREIDGLEKAIEIMNTLEVKEVDLKKDNVIGTLEREVKIDAGGYPYIDFSIEFYDYDKDIPLVKKGDKVKIVVIKGE